jgi:predicted glycosyl hydrolase (DUF1957 family)
MSAGNSRAAYMRYYRKRKRLQEDNCNIVPKRTKLLAERQREYRETHRNLSSEYIRNYRNCKAQENRTPEESTSTDPTPTPIIYNYNQANEYLANHIAEFVEFMKDTLEFDVLSDLSQETIISPA